MTPPSKETVEAAIQSLRMDAVAWGQAGAGLRQAAIAVDGLDFDRFHFSHAGDLVGLTDMYRQVQIKVARLLGEGADNFARVAAALTTAADGYERDERNAVHEMLGVW